MGDIHHLDSKEVCTLKDVRALLIHLCKMQATQLTLMAKEHAGVKVPDIASAAVKQAKEVSEYLNGFDKEDYNKVCSSQ